MVGRCVSGWGEGAEGQLKRIFLQIEFKVRNGLGRTLALQSFRITHLIYAEFLAKVCKTRNKNKVEKNPLKCNFLLII